MSKPKCYGQGDIFYPQHVAEACCDDCLYVKSCYEKSKRRQLMKDIDEARVLKKYLTICGTCGGKKTLEFDGRIFICDACYGIGVTIRKNKERVVKAMLAKKSPKKERTYVK